MTKKPYVHGRIRRRARLRGDPAEQRQRHQRRNERGGEQPLQIVDAAGDAHGLAHRPQHEVAGEQQKEHRPAGDDRRQPRARSMLRSAAIARIPDCLASPCRSQPTAAISDGAAFLVEVRRLGRPSRLSLCRFGLPVAGITTVTAGWLKANLRNACAHDVMPAAAAQSGQRLVLHCGEQACRLRRRD